MKLPSGGQDTSRQTCGVVKIGGTGEGSQRGCGGGRGWTHSGLDMRSEQRRRKTGGGVRSREKERPVLSSAPLSILTPVQGRGPRACENGTWKQPPWPSARWLTTTPTTGQPGRPDVLNGTGRPTGSRWRGAESGAQRECHPWVLGAQGRPHCKGGGNSELSPLLRDTRSRPRVPRESIWLAEPRPRRPPLSAGV